MGLATFMIFPSLIIIKFTIGPVLIRHRSHHFATQSSHFVDRAGWQAKMDSDECCIPWHNALSPHCCFSQAMFTTLHTIYFIDLPIPFLIHSLQIVCAPWTIHQVKQSCHFLSCPKFLASRVHPGTHFLRAMAVCSLTSSSSISIASESSSSDGSESDILKVSISPRRFFGSSLPSNALSVGDRFAIDVDFSWLWRHNIRSVQSTEQLRSSSKWRWLGVWSLFVRIQWAKLGSNCGDLATWEQSRSASLERNRQILPSLSFSSLQADSAIWQKSDKPNDKTGAAPTQTSFGRRNDGNRNVVPIKCLELSILRADVRIDSIWLSSDEMQSKVGQVMWLAAISRHWYNMLFFFQHIRLFIMLFFCSNYVKKYAFCPTGC